MRSHLKQMESEGKDTQNCFSLIVPSSGPPRLVTRLLSSMPRSDVIVLEARSPIPAPRLRPLPLTPFPVYTGTSVLTHLFGSPDPPAVQHSIARTTETHRKPELGGVDKPISWLEGHAWRRWGCGLMLGYRSYTGLELEVPSTADLTPTVANTSSRLEFRAYCPTFSHLCCPLPGHPADPW